MRQRHGNADRGEFRQQSASLLRGAEITDVVGPVGARSVSSEADMTYLTGSSARIGVAALVAVVLTTGICGDAAARTHKRHWHARSSSYESRAQLVSQKPARLGPMRYYGGPKSPMWRGPG